MQALHYASILPSELGTTLLLLFTRQTMLCNNQAYFDLHLSQVVAMSALFEIAIHINVGDVTTPRIKKSTYIPLESAGVSLVEPVLACAL